MNQILVSEKLYVTPELKRKKKWYKFNLIISIILVIVLFSIAAYTRYDRDKQASISQDILAGMTKIKNKFIKDTTTINAEDDVWVIALNGDMSLYNEKEEKNKQTMVDETGNNDNQTEGTENLGVYEADDGTKYYTIGSIRIDKIGVDYPILASTTPSLLKISVCRFWGGNVNEPGNLCIAGHNYRNKRFFSKVPTLNVGDIIEITDINEKTTQYSVYNKYTVEPDDVSCTSQLTNGRTIITLITCTNDNKQRVVVQAEKI